MKIVGIAVIIAIAIGATVRIMWAVRAWLWVNTAKDVGERIARMNAYRTWKRGRRRWFR